MFVAALASLSTAAACQEFRLPADAQRQLSEDTKRAIQIVQAQLGSAKGEYRTVYTLRSTAPPNFETTIDLRSTCIVSAGGYRLCTYEADASGASQTKSTVLAALGGLVPVLTETTVSGQYGHSGTQRVRGAPTARIEKQGNQIVKIEAEYEVEASSSQAGSWLPPSAIQITCTFLRSQAAPTNPDIGVVPLYDCTYNNKASNTAIQRITMAYVATHNAFVNAMAFGFPPPPDQNTRRELIGTPEVQFR
jgi:hypothetical protein